MADLIISLAPTVAPTAAGNVVPHTLRTTAWEMIQYMVDFLGSDNTQEASRIARRSLQAALRELINAHNWTYLYNQGRLFTHGVQTAGTVQYLHSAGANPRQLTLTGATWPSWVES